ncbi:hypothetical protein POSPLADRAFT_1180728 [Postia placenta MAD-698-R-SB12]|uniref:Major facilitator superfamily (MFS) profile domain-containing protein n=2 Tax=Rhodonia placenta TaxID=104341 RepID=A0A1X6N1V0_9APHY|nr:hypothetical protein POSPLADRAFT_1180728 [Postia placenta MAD-698-R-SB12]OSX62599.1 hypothetical protein POSPLADRAFT_1180728 [Postia placenta MAD-698-R-SB12]
MQTVIGDVKGSDLSIPRPDLTLEDIDKHSIGPPHITPVDGGLWAWLSVLGGFCVLTSTFGYCMSFGVYQDYYVLLGSSSSSGISWIGSLQARLKVLTSPTTFLMLFVGLPAGKLFDLGHFHYTLAAGSALHVFSMFMLSLADPHQYYQLILSQGVGMGIGSGLMLVPAMSVQTHHWSKHRSLAMGIVMTGQTPHTSYFMGESNDPCAGSGVGGVIFPIMLNNMIYGRAGFAWAVRATAFLTLGLVIIANSVMTAPLPSVKRRPSGSVSEVKSIMTDRAFLLFLSGLVAILNAASIPGRIVPNLLADRIGTFNIFVPVVIVTGGLVFAMFGAVNTGTVIVFSILYGFFSGAVMALILPTAASVANNVQEIGIRLGLTYFVNSFAILTGTPIDGALYDTHHQWFRPIVFSSVVMLAGSMTLIVSRLLYSSRKRTQIV